jgi:hypothetical protein
MFDEGGDQPNGPEEIGVHHGLGRSQERLGVVPILDLHDAGHRHHDVEFRVVGEHLIGSRGDAVRIGGVDPDRTKSWMLLADAVELVAAPATDDDGVALVGQGQGQGQADAAGGTGDEDGVSGDFHGFALLGCCSPITLVPIARDVAHAGRQTHYLLAGRAGYPESAVEMAVSVDDTVAVTDEGVNHRLCREPQPRRHP